MPKRKRAVSPQLKLYEETKKIGTPVRKGPIS